MNASAALAAELGHDLTSLINLFEVAWLHYLRGEFELAGERANVAMKLGKSHGFSIWPERAALIAGAVLVEQGRVDEGLAKMDDAAAATAARQMRSYVENFGVTVRALAYGRAGRPAEGIQILDSVTTANEMRLYEPETQRVRGELLLVQDATAAAQACFQSAIQLASELQEKSLELRAAVSLARLQRRHGQREAALATLAPVYASFSEGFETTDLRQARRLLDELA
jgi:predicted ATPase